MELKPGYKQTEVGVIPEDWSAEALGPHVAITSGESPSRFSFRSEGTPYFKVDQLNNSNKYQVETPYFFCGEQRVRRGSLLFPKRGASILLNKIRILAVDSFMDTNLMTVTPTDGLDNEYLYYALHHIGLWKVADITSIPQINNKHIKPLVIPIPPKDEQRSIATALSDVDTLISSLDQLIAKKRDIKQATMQQLLTGKQRLPGFSGEWERLQLGYIGKIQGGNGFPLKRQGETMGDYPFFKVSDMNNNGNDTFMVNSKNWISEPTRKEIGATAFPKDAIIFAKIGAAVFLERKKILSIPSCIDNNMAAFIVDESQADPRFAHHLFTTMRFGDLVTATALPALNGRDLAAVEISLPPVCEQIAIASVLSDMDNEIAALEQKRDKTLALKRGMMQELLTGRIRLV